MKQFGLRPFDGCTGELYLNSNIPSSSKNYGVFSYSDFHKIIIGEDVTRIGDYAFSGCDKIAVVINYSDLAIYEGNFGAEKVLNGKDLVIVGDFQFCSSDGAHYLVNYIGKDFSLVLPNNYNGENYHLDSYALYGNNIESLTLGSGILSVGNNALSGRPIKTIWLTNTPPSGYTEAEGVINYVSNDQYLDLRNVQTYPYLSSMFEVNGVKYVPVSPSERTCHAIDCVYGDAAATINVGETTSFKGVAMKVKEIMPYTFYNNSHIKEVVVSHLGNIGSQAFYNCDAIETVNVSNQGYIGNQAFYNCDGIKLVEVSNNGGIGEQVFYNCDAIEIVDISNQGNIGSQAFYDCNGIRCVDIHNQGDISSQAFYGCNGMETAVVANKGSVSDEAFSNCTALKTVTLGDSIGSLGKKTFQNCTGLQEVVIPDYIESVGAYCLSGCSAMKNAVIGAGLTNVKEYTFENCTALTDVLVGDGVTTISNNAFIGCSALTNVSFGKRVVAINDYAFLGCSSLPEITLPQSVTKVGDYAFSGCSKLADVIIADRTKVLTLGSNGSSPLFVDCPLDSVYIGGKITYGKSKDKGYSPFYRNTSLRTVVITDTEEQIYDNEFYGCTSLKNVTVGNGVKGIGNYAFSGCSNLDGFAFGSSLASIGAEAFSDCTNLTMITSHAAVPPTCGSQALDDINKWSCVLRVPKSYAAAYQAADQWKEFFFIEDVVEVKKYALTYIVDGEVYYTDSLAYKETITIIAEPVKEGYTFSGWSELPVTMPANDVTVTGSFTLNSYKITYTVDGAEYATDSIAYGTTLTAIDVPTKEGHTFSGWSELPATMPANDITVSGIFTINKYLVTFKIDDEVIASDSLEYGATIVTPEAPEREGYTFDGWEEVAETVPASDVTYEGSYSVNTYLLIFMVDGETVQVDSVAYGTAIVLLEEPAKEGYTFSGWSEAPETMPANDITVSGAFTINKYLVTFKIDDEVIASDSLEYGAMIVTPEAPEREGYTFDGWGDVVETVPANDVTIEGSYTANIYKVYYYVGEELVHTAEVTYGEAIPEYIYEPTEEGYTFLGWLGELYETMPAHDVTYTANIESGINQLLIDNGQLTIYDLAGRKVLNMESLKGGIYIVNGKKVVFK